MFLNYYHINFPIQFYSPHLTGTVMEFICPFHWLLIDFSVIRNYTQKVCIGNLLFVVVDESVSVESVLWRGIWIEFLVVISVRFTGSGH